MSPQSAHNIVLPKSVGNRFKAAYHYVECETDYLIEPESTQEVADAVKAYRQLAELQGAALKIRASRRCVAVFVGRVLCAVRCGAPAWR
jgi:hypothetical protein